MSEVKKKKRVSKKNKKAWGKYCDIRDVEEFLEDQRLEERLGKFETKPDSELFVIDTGGENANENEIEDKKPILSAKLQKRAKLKELPKCFEVLLPTSKVQDPNAKRNRVNPIGWQKTALSKLTEKRKAEKGVFQKKLEEAKKNRKMTIDKKRKAKKVRENFSVDLWNSDSLEAKGIPKSLCEEFISPEAQLHNVLTTQRLRPKPPVANTLVTRAAIEAPHPGVSYNPSYKEHQDLLQQVCQHEQKMIKREEHLLRVTTGMFRRVTQQEKENQWQEEMSVGLQQPHNPANDPDSSSDSDNEYKAVNPPVKNKKKDHKARRKQREQIEEKEKLKRKKIDKKKITDLYKLRKLQSSISKEENEQALERTKRTEKRVASAATALPTLSAHKTPAVEPEFVESSQLSGDLRNIKSNSNLLRDRFVSLQRRGALAASKVMMKKKRKLKSYFKPGHKVTDNDVEKFIKKSSAKSDVKPLR